MRIITFLAAAVAGAPLFLSLPFAAEARSRDHSGRVRPQGLGRADVDGDGIADWVGIDTERQGSVNVYLGSNRDFYITRLTGGATGFSNVTYPRYTITGHFQSRTKDDICVFSMLYLGWAQPRLDCYTYNAPYQMYGFGNVSAGSGGDMHWALPMQIESASAPQGYAVGDFDGDGFDEIVTYDHAAGANIKFWRYNPPTGTFVQNPNIDIGNLGGLSWPGGVELRSGELSGPDASGARRDDLLVFNRSNRQASMYWSALSGNHQVFWWAYTWSTPVTTDEDFEVASADGDACDDLISMNHNTGAMRFLELCDWSKLMTPRPGVVQGNITSASNQGIHFMSSSNGNGRDEITAVFADTTVQRFGPVTDGDQQTQTYWWIGSYGLDYVWSRIKP
jgi:hypothetical protein